MSISRRGLLPYFVPVLISAALSSTMFYQVRLLAPQYSENKDTFFSYVGGKPHYESLRREWRTRLFSNYLAHLFVRAGQRLSWDKGSDDVAAELAAAMWAAVWLFLVNGTFIFARRERSLLYILGTYAGVSFGYMPGISVRIYPWDMPALFFFSLFLVLLDRGETHWLLLVLAVGTGFKETTLLLCLAFLFLEAPFKRRMTLFVGGVLLCGVVKLLIDVGTRSPSVLFTMTIDSWAIRYNVEAILGIHRNTRLLRHPVLINAGTLVGFLLLPNINRRMTMLKTICIFFAVGNLLFGVVREYRIWFEMIPVALYGLELYFFRQNRVGVDA